MNRPTIKATLIILFSVVIIDISGQSIDPPFLKYMNHPWVDSVMRTLSTEERVAQLIWVAAFSNRDISHEVYLSDIIRKNGIGGIIFFQNNAQKQAEMINYYRKISKVPLMVVTDGEYGLGMRLENVVKFPFQMTLGCGNKRFTDLSNGESCCRSVQKIWCSDKPGPCCRCR